VKKLTIIIVEEGPRRLNRDVPNRGSIKLKVIAGMKVRSIPKKQYLIWLRANPIDFLKDLIRKKIPPDIKTMK
jgi:hypothetical protein